MATGREPFWDRPWGPDPSPLDDLFPTDTFPYEFKEEYESSPLDAMEEDDQFDGRNLFPANDALVVSPLRPVVALEADESDIEMSSSSSPSSLRPVSLYGTITTPLTMRQQQPSTTMDLPLFGPRASMSGSHQQTLPPPRTMLRKFDLRTAVSRGLDQKVIHLPSREMQVRIAQSPHAPCIKEGFCFLRVGAIMSPFLQIIIDSTNCLAVNGVISMGGFLNEGSNNSVYDVCFQTTLPPPPKRTMKRRNPHTKKIDMAIPPRRPTCHDAALRVSFVTKDQQTLAGIDTLIQKYAADIGVGPLIYNDFFCLPGSFHWTVLAEENQLDDAMIDELNVITAPESIIRFTAMQKLDDSIFTFLMRHPASHLTVSDAEDVHDMLMTAVNNQLYNFDVQTKNIMLTNVEPATTSLPMHGSALLSVPLGRPLERRFYLIDYDYAFGPLSIMKTPEPVDPQEPVYDPLDYTGWIRYVPAFLPDVDGNIEGPPGSLQHWRYMVGKIWGHVCLLASISMLDYATEMEGTAPTKRCAVFVARLKAFMTQTFGIPRNQLADIRTFITFLFGNGLIIHRPDGVADPFPP